MLRPSRQWLTALLFVALPLAAQTTRVIGYAQDGRTTIEARISAGYSGTGGTLLIAGLDGTAATGTADVVIPLANPLKAILQFPPMGMPYKEHAESWALWRWIQFHSPREITIQGADPAGLRAALAQRPTPGPERTPIEVARQLATVYGHDSTNSPTSLEWRSSARCGWATSTPSRSSRNRT